jgi:Fe-S oxidoreductase
MESVVSEISELYYKYDIKHFRFSDSNFLGTGKLAYKRAVELAEGLLKNNLEITFEMHCRSDTLLPEVISKLKSCGLRYLSIGIESMSSNQLRRFEKRETISDHIAAVDLIQKNGLAAQGYCILAEPLVTRRELMENLEGLYELSKKILILINEKMILFNSVKYYEKHCKIIPGLEFSSFSFDTALQYEFKDPWCKENYAFVEEISLYLKYKSQALQKKYRPGISTIDLYLFIKKATSYRIEVLNRTVQDDYPDKGKVMCWCEEAIGKIKRIL